MSTYIKGADTYLPEIKPFTPDYKFLSAVLDTRQDRYDTNFKATNDLYNKVVYADLSRQDTRDRRDQYAEQIAPHIEKISGMDLSIAANVEAAKGVFAPFYEDDLTVKDVMFTAAYRDQMQRADNLKNSPNVDVADKWWDVGVRAMQYQMDEFMNSSADDALRQGLPEYVPDADLFKMSQKILEEMDPPLKMKMDRFAIVDNPKFNPNKPEGPDNLRKINNTDWIITEQNGTLVTGAALQQIRNRLMNHPNVQRAYQTEAYVMGMDFATNAVRNGAASSLKAGQEMWANETIRRITAINDKKLPQALQDLAAAERAAVTWDSYKLTNGLVEGSEIDQLHDEELSDIEAYKRDIENMKKIQDEGNLPASDSLAGTLNRAYSMLMQHDIMNDMMESAQAFSARDYEYTMRENKYAVQEKEFQYNMAEIKARAINAMNLEKFKQDREDARMREKIARENAALNNPLNAALQGNTVSVGDAQSIDVATKDGEATQNVDMIQRSNTQYIEADQKLATTQVDDILNMMQLMNPKGDNSSQDQTFGVMLPGEEPGTVEEYRGTIENIRRKLLTRNTTTVDGEEVPGDYKYRNVINDIFTDKNNAFVDTRLQTKNNPNLTLGPEGQTMYDDLYNKMNGPGGTLTQMKGVDAFITDTYEKYEKVYNDEIVQLVQTEDKHVKNLMQNGNMPGLFLNGIPFASKEEYIKHVVKGVEKGEILNVDLDWKWDTGTSNTNYKIPANQQMYTEYGVEEIPLYNEDGSRKYEIDMSAVEAEAGMVYDALKSKLNAKLTGQLGDNFVGGDFNSARYGFGGAYSDVVSSPTYNYSLNPLTSNPGAEAEMINLVNQLNYLEKDNKAYGMGYGKLNKEKELLEKNALAVKVWNLYKEDLQTWYGNPKRSNTDAIAPVATLRYKPVFDIASKADKTHAGYEIVFSPEWLASKVKGPASGEYGALSAADVKLLQGVGDDNEGAGIFMVYDQNFDQNMKSNNTSFYSPTEIDIVSGTNGYADYTIPNDNGITPTVQYRVIKNGTNDYVLNADVNMYIPYEEGVERQGDYRTQSITYNFDMSQGLRGLEEQMANQRAYFDQVRLQNQLQRKRDEAQYGNK